jgi:phosphatidylserine/phosphatidylglycerophosphate/cardiolipin synthase-like enzyme
MHSKFALYDRKNLVVGSTNWSFHAMFLNREASVVVDDSGVSRAFSEIFEGDWSESAPYLN